MKVAIVGSRSIVMKDFSEYLPADVTEIVSGGAHGIDRSAAAYAQSHGIPLTEFLPDYTQYGKSAPLRRNVQIIEYADIVLVFWDGRSRGSKFVIDNCKKRGKPYKTFLLKGYDPL